MAEEESLGRGSLPGGLGEVSSAIAALAAAVSSLPEGEDFHFYRNFAPLRARVGALRVGAGEALGLLRAAEWGEDAAEAQDSLVDLLDDALEGVDAALDEARRAPEGAASGLSSSLLQHSARSQGGSARAEGGLFDRQGLAGDSAAERRGGQHRELPRFGSTSQPSAAQRAGWRPQDDFPVPPDNSCPSALLSAPPLASTSGGTLPPESSPGLSPRQAGGSAPDRVAAHALRMGVASAGKKGAGGAAGQAAKEALLRVPQKWQAFQMEVGAEQVRRDGDSVSSAVRRRQRLQDTPFLFVDSLEALEAAARALEGAQEIAVDLENHSFRSFQGFLCLMQLSTRTHDFVIDTLAPAIRQHLPRLLGPVFQSPEVVKVMHGANMDVVWLQRDFEMLVANLFDTGQAARVLGLPSFGLAHLLKDICGVTANKSLQMADWRLRPLPADMLKYAREDTHYLLHIYDVLRQRLLQAPASPLAPLPKAAGPTSRLAHRPSDGALAQGASTPEAHAPPLAQGASTPEAHAPRSSQEDQGGAADASPASAGAAKAPVSSPDCASGPQELLAGPYPAGARKIVEVLERSLSVCLLEYHPPAFNPAGYLKVYDGSRLLFTEQQLSAMAALYAWRDSLARSLDESNGYVLPNHMLIRLAKTLPASLGQLRSLVRGSAPLVLEHAAHVLALIQGAHEVRAQQLPGAQEPLTGAQDPGLLGAHPQGAGGLEAQAQAPHSAPGQEQQAQGSVAGQAGSGPTPGQGSGETAEAQAAGAEAVMQGVSSAAGSSLANSGGREAGTGSEEEGVAATQGAQVVRTASQGVSRVPIVVLPTGEGVSGVSAAEEGGARATPEVGQGAGTVKQAQVPAVVVSRRGSSKGALGSMLGTRKKAAGGAPPAATTHPAVAPPLVAVPPAIADPPAAAQALSVPQQEPSASFCMPGAQAAASSAPPVSAVSQRRSASAGVLGSLLGAKRRIGQSGTGAGNAAASAAAGASQGGAGRGPGSFTSRQAGCVPDVANAGRRDPVTSSQAVVDAAAQGAAGTGGPLVPGRAPRDGSGVAGLSASALQDEVLARVRLSVAGVHPSAAARALPAGSCTWGKPSGQWGRAAGAVAQPDVEAAGEPSGVEQVEQAGDGGEEGVGVEGDLVDEGGASLLGAEETFIGFDAGESRSPPESDSGEELPPDDQEGPHAGGPQVREDPQQASGSALHAVSAGEGLQESKPSGQGQRSLQEGDPPSAAAGEDPGALAGDSLGSGAGEGGMPGGASGAAGAEPEAGAPKPVHDDAPCAEPRRAPGGKAEAPFDFEAARRKFNLWGSAPKKEAPQPRKGGKKRPLPPVASDFFDPMAPLRQDSHAGPKGGKRSQVFPRGGNRSHTFRD